MSFTGKEKAFGVLEFDKNNSWTCVQRNFEQSSHFQSSHQTDVHERFLFSSKRHFKQIRDKSVEMAIYAKC